MRGKIFADSENIHQDQARILFNYYKQVAEMIVAEEERIEGEIKKLEGAKAELEQKAKGLWVWFLTIILFWVYFIKKGEISKQLAEIQGRIDEFNKQHKEIFRGYRVTKLGVAYVPVAEQVAYDGKSFIVDYSGSVPNTEITLQMSRQNKLMVDTIRQLDQLSKEAPIVEGDNDTERIETDDYSRSIQALNQYDFLGGLERSLRTISFCMEDLNSTSVSLPLVEQDSEHLRFLREFGTGELDEGAAVLTVFNQDKHKPDIERFQQLNDLKKSISSQTEAFEDVLKSLIASIAQSVQAVSALKVASVNKVVAGSNKTLFNILKSPYNFYSPTLEHEEIERIRGERFDYKDIERYEPFNLKQSSRMRFNLLTGLWTAEDGSSCSMPFGVHQVYQEIMAPVVQNLLEENRIERLKIYNHIKDQKISYLNKWHQDTDAFYRANRAESSDIINLMQESLREYVAAYNTLVSLQRTEESMKAQESLDSTVVKQQDNSAESLLAFQTKSEEFSKVQNDFEEYMERLQDDINQRAERFGHVEYYDGRLRDGYSNEVAVATGEVGALDDRRKALATVNPLFAKAAQLPPAPHVEDLAHEHMALNLPAIAKSALNHLEGKGEGGSPAQQNPNSTETED